MHHILLLSHAASFQRILHLAIIHEDQHFAHQLIQWFPKDVLDIQNNLYQVGDFPFLNYLAESLLETGACTSSKSQSGVWQQ